MSFTTADASMLPIIKANPSHGDFFHAGIELYNPAARRAAPSGICVRTALATRAGQGSAPLLKYVKDLTPSDTLVNCTYLVCTLWDTFFTVSNIL
jgi:hypothetical protein